MINETILEMQDITKYFAGVTALSHVQFTLRRGECHALVGENGAGKSTLMRCLLGIHAPNEGSIRLRGKEVSFRSPHDALTAGISMIHQEISLIPTTSVAENIWIGRENRFLKFGLISSKERAKATKELLDDLGICIDPDAIVGTLSVAMMQLVEIARAVSYNSDIIIMDEPTSALAKSEIELLYKIIRQLNSRGVAIIFISHKIDEIFEVCDRLTVLRDGQWIVTENIKNVTFEDIIRYIVGREMTNMFPKLPAKIGKTMFEVRNLNSPGFFRDISFYVRSGEIVGFSGLMGAGRSELMRAIFGADSYTSGEMYLEGKQVRFKTPGYAIRHGVGMLTEDRLRLGAIHMLSVRFNIAIANIRKYVRGGVRMNDRALRSDADAMIDKLQIKTSNPNQPIAGLSGGNQQKCLIGRWLLIHPKVLILDEPTRGIDVGSKAEIHRLISALAQEGLAVIMVSSELPEIIGMCDRAYVMNDGCIVAEFNAEEFDQERMITAAFKG